MESIRLLFFLLYVRSFTQTLFGVVWFEGWSVSAETILNNDEESCTTGHTKFFVLQLRLLLAKIKFQ